MYKVIYPSQHVDAAIDSRCPNYRAQILCSVTSSVIFHVPPPPRYSVLVKTDTEFVSGNGDEFEPQGDIKSTRGLKTFDTRHTYEASTTKHTTAETSVTYSLAGG